MKIADDATKEIDAKQRFAFGANWANFLIGVDMRQVEKSKDGLRKMLNPADLEGRTFLDAGCGSGLHSLAAWTLGANVVSFDFDAQCVECAVRLHVQVKADAKRWHIVNGSVLDRSFLRKLGTFGVVYSWGVLHHTGFMWDALSNVAELVAEGGILFIAIYNDQGWVSRYWKVVKMLYNRHAIFRWFLIAAHFPYLMIGRRISHAWKGKRSLDRGMSYWTDMKDWLGGIPFEVARPDEVIEFLLQRGFNLEKIKTCGRRSGCNEFVLRKRRA